MSSKLFFSTHPLVVDVDLAVLLGLDQSVVVQQLHYWLEHQKNKKTDRHIIDGKWWCFNTLDQWQGNFPFWGIDKIKKTLLDLERRKIIISRQDLNKAKYDRTKWYTIDYEAIELLKELQPSEITHSAKRHNGMCRSTLSKMPNGTIEDAKRHGDYHKISLETSEETTTKFGSYPERKTKPHPRLYELTWRGEEEVLRQLADQFPEHDVYSLADQIDYQHFVQPCLVGQRREPRGLLLNHLRENLSYTHYKGYTITWREDRDQRLLNISTPPAVRSDLPSFDAESTVTNLHKWQALPHDLREQYLAAILSDHYLFDADDCVLAPAWADGKLDQLLQESETKKAAYRILF